MSIFQSAAWDVTGRIVNQVIAFVVSVILARLLSPQDFGIMGIALALVAFSTMFLDMGFKNAVIIFQEKSGELYSSVLWINLLIAVVLALIFFIAAPFIANFYKEEQVGPVIRWTVLMFIINALSLIPAAINFKALRFRELAMVNVFSSLVSGSVAIWMAFTGWGVWSILARSIINATLSGILNWLMCKWIPSLVLSLKYIRTIWGYSSRMFATNVMEMVIQKLDILIMARVYNSTTVGYYTRAQSLDSISRELVAGSMYSVFLPYFGRIQKEPEKITTLYMKSLHIMTSLLVLLTGALFLNAHDIFVLLYTRKWEASVPLFRFLSVIGFFLTVTMVMNILVSGIGRSIEFLRAELAKKGILILAFAIGFSGSLDQFLYAFLIATIAGTIIMAYVVQKVAHVAMIDQLKVLCIYVGLGLFTATVVSYLLSDLAGLSPLLRIVLTGGAYLLIYTGLNALLNTKAFTLAKEQIHKHIFRRNLNATEG
jgi:teichuronic acid exporter